MIYFVRTWYGDGPTVKIGFSRDFDTRLRALRYQHGPDLVPIRLIQGHLWQERWLHRYFTHLRIVKEWFSFDSEMLSVQPPAETPVQIKHMGRWFNQTMRGLPPQDAGTQT